MKIACISASRIPSTTANSIQAMKACQALAQIGHEVTLLAPELDSPEGSEPIGWERLSEHYGLQTPFAVERLGARPGLKRYDFAYAAVGRARGMGAELIYTWMPQAALFALWRRLPAMLELHGEPEGSLGPMVFRLILSAGGRRRFLPVTQALANSIFRSFQYSWKPGELVISPNGVDLERYQDLPAPSEARQQLGLPDVITTGYTGHLYAGRGADLLAELAGRFPQVSFLWVGGREMDVEAWRERLEEMELSNVILTGFVENARLPLYQAAADILLMPYERKIAGSGGGDSAAYASPMKLFEYLASGRAILSSDLPVIREALDESNAFLCPPEDADAWANSLETLIENEDLRRELGKKARRDAQMYTWKERALRALEGFDAG